MLQDAELDWKTKELLIPKATHRNECQYCIVQHEAVSQRLGVTADTIAALEGNNYKSSDLFTDGEKALLDLTVQIVEAVYVITQYIAISRFGDALGVALEPAFQGGEPILHVDHAR